VPEDEDLDGLGRDPVIEMVVNTVQMEAADASKPCSRHQGPCVRLDREEIEGLVDLFTESIGSLRTVRGPPSGCHGNLPGSTPQDFDGKP
jgi:hypothetical protein